MHLTPKTFVCIGYALVEIMFKYSENWTVESVAGAEATLCRNIQLFTL